MFVVSCYFTRFNTIVYCKHIVKFVCTMDYVYFVHVVDIVIDLRLDGCLLCPMFFGTVWLDPYSNARQFNLLI